MTNQILASRYEAILDNHKVHGSLYTDDAIFRDELDKVFGKLWVFVCHESEIPNRTNYVRRTIGLHGVIAVRSKDDRINVFLNRCPHRGNSLCSRDAGSNAAFVCNYHGWSYNLEGQLTNVPGPKGFVGEKTDFPLQKALVEVYRGFVFATLNPAPAPLAEQLGNAKGMIDRAVEMSPTGSITLSGGWIKHRLRANWKLVVEGAVDGAHSPWVHASFFRAVQSNYDQVTAAEDDLLAEAVDLGGGHMDHDFSNNYAKPLQWFGSSEEKYPGYVMAMRQAYGGDAERKLIDGPPHVTIFPNMFLAEMNIVMFQPISPNETIQWHTPLLIDGIGSELNSRILRQTEGALGPASIVVTDDTCMMERVQSGIDPETSWFDLSRGVNREVAKDDGTIVGHFTDEVNNRGFWRHYRNTMLAE